MNIKLVELDLRMLLYFLRKLFVVMSDVELFLLDTVQASNSGCTLYTGADTNVIHRLMLYFISNVFYLDREPMTKCIYSLNFSYFVYV